MIKFSSKINYLFLFSIVIFSIFYFYYKPKPKLSNIVLKDEISILNSGIFENGLIDYGTTDNRVNIGKYYFFRDNIHWYHVNHLSFWSNESLDLNLIDKLSKNKNFEIKNLDSNNYAQVTYKGEKVVYACIKRTGDFYYKFNHKNIIRTTDFYYWKKIFIHNIMLVFNSFKPRNSECLLVITSNINLFEKEENKIKKLILNKFIY